VRVFRAYKTELDPTLKQVEQFLQHAGCSSSKACSTCGNVKTELGLDERTYHCEACGAVIDRDLNASLNLKSLAGSSPVSACCPGSSGHARKRVTKLLVGQELNRKELAYG
jgi:transposase